MLSDIQLVSYSTLAHIFFHRSSTMNMTVRSKMTVIELCRSKRVSYNAFEFRANEKPITPTLPTKAVCLAVKAISVLHNSVRQTSPARICYTTKEMVDIFDVHTAVHRNTISIVKPTRCTNVSNLFYFGMTFYMFRTVFPSIIRSARLYILQQAYVCQQADSRICNRRSAREILSKKQAEQNTTITAT